MDLVIKKKGYPIMGIIDRQNGFDKDFQMLESAPSIHSSEKDLFVSKTVG